MPEKQDRIIIDTNLWISFILTSNFTELDKLLNQRQAKILFGEELLKEFITVAQRPKFRKYFTPDNLQELLSVILTEAEFVEVKTRVNVCRDLKDNFLLSLAKDGKATHLLTGDKDLLDLGKFEETDIISLRKYLEK